MSLNPRGSIVRTMRLSTTETTDTGATVTRTVSGGGIVIRIKPDVPGMKPAEVRRAFTRAARGAGVILTVVETAYGHYTATGKAIVEGAPSAYQCVGTASGLQALVRHFAVAEWSFAVGVRVPVVAQGSGPEKVRPSMGSRFGKPGTVAATAAQLAKQRADAIRAEVSDHS